MRADHRRVRGVELEARAVPRHARSAKSCTPSDAFSGPTANSCSARTRSASRLVARIFISGAAPSRSGRRPGRGQHVLEVVDDKEQRTVDEVGLQRFDERLLRHVAQADGRRDRRRDKIRIAQRRQRNERGAGFEAGCNVGGRAQREAGLADPAESRERDEADLVAVHERAHVVELVTTTHERARVGRQREVGVRRGRRGRREQRFAQQQRHVVGHQLFELVDGRERLVRHVAARADAIEHGFEAFLAPRVGALDVDELRLRSREEVLVFEPRHVHARCDPAVPLPVDRDEHVALFEVRAVEAAGRMCAGAHLEQHRREPQPLDGAAHCSAFGGEFLHRRRDEDPNALIGRQDRLARHALTF